MKMTRVRPKFSLLYVIVVLLITLVVTFVIAKQEIYASNTNPNLPIAQMYSPGTPAPLPLYHPGPQAEIRNSAVSSALSYYFIGGNTFTSNLGTISYARQVVGCVNQMPLNVGFSAPVHLPQGSQVVSITLYTYDTVQAPTISTGWFIVDDGKGNGSYYLSASSLPNISEYQQNDSAENNPVLIDNQNYNYLIEWRKLGDTDSTYLSLCGVRIAYHSPTAGFLLPIIKK